METGSGENVRSRARIGRRDFLRYGSAAVLAASIGGFPVGALAAPMSVRTSNRKYPIVSIGSSPVQTMAGFGASGAWWPNDLANFSATVQSQVADMLFGASGIALSVYRYNVGATEPGINYGNPVRAPQTFLVSAGSYDWTRDPGGRLFLDLAHSRSVPTLVAFAYSAPGIWTTNGSTQGGSLLPGSESAYAGYLTDIVDHFHTAEGIDLAYVSPMNEPDYTFAGSSQEGMGVPVAQRATLVQALGAQLASRAAYARATADEASHVGDQFNVEVPQWMNVTGTPQSVAVLSHHFYDFPNASTLQQAQQIGSSYGKALWCTEVCCFNSSTGQWGRQFDPTIASAVMLGSIIWRCLTYANDAAFHWWVACSSALGFDPVSDPSGLTQVNATGWNDGLLYYDPNYASNGNQAIYTTKRFYGMGNFSRYVRPGDRRYSVSGSPSNLEIAAFATATGWSVVVVNTSSAGSAPTTFQLRLTSTATPTGAYETSATRNLQAVAVPTFSRGVSTITVPAQSLTTLTFAA